MQVARQESRNATVPSAFTISHPVRSSWVGERYDRIIAVTNPPDSPLQELPFHRIPYFITIVNTLV
jgi:hypothetical protein